MENKNFIPIVTRVALLGVLLVVGYFIVSRVDTYLDIQKRAMLNQAIDECSRNTKYTYENPSAGIKTEEPIKDRYDECLKEKGLK